MRTISLCLIFLSMHFAQAQCKQVRDTSLSSVMYYYEQQAYDSIMLVVSRWEEKCGMNEELFRLSVLSRIQSGVSIQPLMNRNVIGHLRSFESKAMSSLVPYFHSSTYAGDTLASTFNTFTANWATALATEDELSNLFLTVYTSKNSSTAWRSLISGSFPQQEVQTTFDEIKNATENHQDLLVLKGGGWFHGESKSSVAQFGLAYDRIKPTTFSAVGMMLRFGGEKQIELTYKDVADTISSNGIYVHYDYGRRVRKQSADYLFFGALSHTLMLSDYGFVSDRKRMISSFNLGVGAAIHFKGKRMNKAGLELRYAPINFITNKEVELHLASFSINVKYLLRTAREAREFLKPIGYYK